MAKPLTITTPNAASDATPNTYTHEASSRERQQRRGAEDRDHHRDQDQVRHGNREDVPVEVRTGQGQVDGGGNVSRQGNDVHRGLQVSRQSIALSLSVRRRDP
jgi:hypothetical protein